MNQQNRDATYMNALKQLFRMKEFVRSDSITGELLTADLGLWPELDSEARLKVFARQMRHLMVMHPEKFLQHEVDQLKEQLSLIVLQEGKRAEVPTFSFSSSRQFPRKPRMQAPLA